MNNIMMKCGHSANAKFNGKPCCAVCLCSEMIDTPNLKGRQAKCNDCNNKTDSKIELPFFQSKPNKKYDSYYCGCLGWE